MPDDPWAKFRAPAADTEAKPDAPADDPWAKFRTGGGKPAAAVSDDHTTLTIPVGEKKSTLEAINDVNPVTRMARAAGDVIGRVPEVSKGVLAGALENVTGLGELLPGAAGRAAARGTQELEKVGDKTGRMGGYLGAQAFPVVKGANLASKGLEGLMGGRSILSDIGGGAVTGMAAGAAEPTGKESGKARAEEKAVRSLAGGAAGSVLGAVPGAVEAASKVPGMVRAAVGKEGRAAAEELRGRVSEGAGNVAADAAATAGQKTGEIVGHEAALAKHEQELAKIDAAQQQIADREVKRAMGATVGRDPVTGQPIAGSRDAAAALTPEKQAEIRTMVSARLRDRVREAEGAARRAGLSAEEAQTFARNEESRLVDAEAAAQQIINEQAAQPALSPEDMGAQIQKAASAMYDKYSAIREAESGFGQVMREHGDVEVPTADIISYIDEIEPKIANGSTQGILSWVKSQVRGAAQDAAGEATEGPAAINLEKANSLRKTLNTAIRTKQMTVANNTTADAGEAAHYLGKIQGLLVDSSIDTVPEYSTALEKWRELSRPLDIFQRKGTLRQALATDPLSGEFLMDEARVVGQLMTKTRGGSQALGKLVQESPQLKDALRMYFNRMLFGFEGADRKVTEQAFSGFLRQNEQALRQAGLFDEFATMKGAQDAGRKAVANVTERMEAARDAAKIAERGAKEAEKDVSTTRSLSDRAARREAETLKEKPSNEAAKTAELRARDAKRRLDSHESEIREKTAAIDRQLKEALGDRAKAETAVRDYQNLQAEVESLRSWRVGDVANKSRSIARKMAQDGVITNAEYQEFLSDVNEVEHQLHQTDEARRRILKLAGGLAGVSTLSYVAHKVARDFF